MKRHLRLKCLTGKNKSIMFGARGVLVLLGLLLLVPLAIAGGTTGSKGQKIEKGAGPVDGGIPVPPDMLAHPFKYFPVRKDDNTLNLLKSHGFHIFDDIDHHRAAVQSETGMHVRFAKLEINIPRRCFWVAYHFWEKRHALQKFLPPKLMRSLFDMAVVKKDDEMGGILCLMDLKTGKFFLGFGIFTQRKEFKTDNQLAERRSFRDYVALRDMTPAQAEVLKEAAQWIFPRKKQLTKAYWEPVGEKLVKARNAKL